MTVVEAIKLVLGYAAIGLIGYGLYVYFTLPEEPTTPTQIFSGSQNYPSREDVEREFENLTDEDKEELYIEALEAEYADTQAEIDAHSQYRPY